jgi:hypothetical protein
MKIEKIVITLLITLFTGTVVAHSLGICQGEYALCAASPTTPTGKTMLIDGKTFREGMAVCPVLNGISIANLDLMKGTCDIGPGKVWSLFGIPPVTEYPQAPSWDVTPAEFRSFTIGETQDTGMSNMWSFPCLIQEVKVNGVTLASCYGPIMESPWTNDHVKPGQTGFTQAPEGAIYPVGGNAPQKP